MQEVLKGDSENHDGIVTEELPMPRNKDRSLVQERFPDYHVDQRKSPSYPVCQKINLSREGSIGKAAEKDMT